MWKNTIITNDESGNILFQSDHQTVAERKEFGKRLRSEIPRESHSSWSPSLDQRDPVKIIQESNIGRLPDLIPIRYARMLTSPFAFYRGAAALMAYDLSGTPQSDIIVQACGDCHLSNFGLFATPERNLVFDINDFDETHPACFEWDLKRLSTSFYIASQSNGFSMNECMQVVLSCLSSYRESIRKFSTMRLLDVWYLKLRMEDIIALSKTDEERKNREKISAKARQRIGDYIYPKITTQVNGNIRIVDQPPLIYHPNYQEGNVKNVLEGFDQYYRTLSRDKQFLLDRHQIVDLVVKVVGIGSVGTRCGLLLMIGEDEVPLLLQVKEARPSVLEPYTKPCSYSTHGERVVQGQRLMQSASDPFLGWTSAINGIHFYLRQYRDMKFSLDIASMNHHGLEQYAKFCGWTLARAHSRAGDPATIAGYIGKSDTFDKALVSFAKSYAKQNEQDYKKLMEAAKSGLITVAEKGW